jgi:hypothetical protein
MTRIQPECFIEVYKHSKTNTKYYDFWITDTHKPEFCSSQVVALFLIKPQTTTLEARLINRAIVRQNAKI